jgi:hypothetical protein
MISNRAAADVLMHKFKIGQTVYLERSLAVPGGAYVITKKCRSAMVNLNIE